MERDKASLISSLIQSLQLPEETSPAKLVSNLSSLTDPEKVKSLGILSDEEKESLNLLEKKLLDLQAKDPAKTAKELTLREGRYRTLLNHLKKFDESLSLEAVNNIFNALADVKTKRDTAIKLRQATFPKDLLNGTGSDLWTIMWEAAKQFSGNKAYPDADFPLTEQDARCLLCQQELNQDAVERLKQFEMFVMSAAESELRTAKDRYLRLFQGLEELKVASNETETAIKEIRIEDENLADKVKNTLIAVDSRHLKVLDLLRLSQELPPDLPDYVSITDSIQKLTEQTHNRVQGLKKQTDAGQKEKITKEVIELKARETLGKNEGLVLAEIERKKKQAAYGLCIDDTRTQTITTKSTAVTKIVVTQQLMKSFKEELIILNFKHIEIELKEIGGDFGNTFHKLILTRAPGVELPKVVSEGEARCLSIAAFFSELSTASDPSAILFDDPVSSFDYKWRARVAKRLVHEAKTRQVIVFTHDIVFLLSLHQYAEEQNVDLLNQHVRQLSIGAGVCAEELPWVALSVKKRIGHLKKLMQTADKLYKDGHQNQYDREASYIYGLLREAWERGVEEVLLNGVVERYRTGVQTQQIKNIADITDADCNNVEVAITKCSKWLTGHDQSPAAKEDIPEPDELKADIDTLNHWVKEIRKRRQ